MARKSGTEQRGVRGKGEEAKRGRDEIERREGRDREKGGREGRKRPERGGGGEGDGERERGRGTDGKRVMRMEKVEMDRWRGEYSRLGGSILANQSA